VTMRAGEQELLLTSLVEFISPMSRTIKSGLLVMAAAVCIFGVLLAPRATAPERESKTHVVPVKNAQPQRGIGLRV
jgi:hypothetical protein